MPPALGNGKIGYLEIPAIDPGGSFDFYHAVFGWQIRRRGDGQLAFDDGVGQVSGTWVTGRPLADGRVAVHAVSMKVIAGAAVEPTN